MKRTTARRLARLLPHWARVRYGEELAAYFAGRPDSTAERMTALRWAIAARLADPEDRVRGMTRHGLSEQIRRHTLRLVRAAALAAGGGIALYEMVDDSPLAKVVNAGGYLALDWRLVILSLLVAGTTTALMLIELVRQQRARSAPAGGEWNPSPSSGRSARLTLLGRVTAGAVLVTAVSGLILVASTNAPFSLGPVRIPPGAGRLIASLLFSAGGISALRNTRLMSGLIALLGRRRP